MRRVRCLIALTTFAATFVVLAPAALAVGQGGQGWYGETTDPVITATMFMVIAFFPLLILVLTLIQTRLDKRKHARMDAAKARQANADWRGGW
jgi:preprotein translocase subunit SecG